MVVSFLELPPELLDKVLAFLDPPSIVRARCICKQLDSAITYSSMLQYIIECYTSGMADNHEPGLSFKERLDLLRRREVAWRSLEKTHSYSIRVPFMSNGLYDFTEGILVLGIGSKETGGYAYLRLPPAGDTSIPSWSYFRVPEKLVDFGLSVIQHDLIAAVTMSVHHQDITFSLYFYSLSDGSPHPMASRSMIRLCSGTTTNEHISALIEIVGDYIIILLTGPAPDKLFLVNWKKGSARLIRSFSQKTYSGLAWLSEDTIVVFNMREVSFDVFRFDGPLEDGVPDMAMIYRLKLPELEDGVTIQLAQCRADPNPLTVPSKSGTRDRPFYTVPETSILLVSLTFFSPGERFTLSIIVHRSALLAAAPLDGYSAEEDPTQPPTVPYKDWGVKSTAWFFNDSSYITVTNGQRYTLIEREFPNADNLDELNVITVRKLYVRDFNPVHVRAARALTDKDDEIAEGLIADRRQLDFTEDYFVDGCPEFELPYVQRTKELPDIFGEIYMDAWVDEQRILLLRLNPLIHDIAGADIWVFG